MTPKAKSAQKNPVQTKQEERRTRWHIPRSFPEASTFVAKIGALSRTVEETVAAFEAQKRVHEKEIEKLREAAQKKIAPSEEQIAEILQCLHAYCEQHRRDLTKDGRSKTVDFHSGNVSWRWSPWRATFRKVDDVIRSVKKRRLTKQFIRKKEELDKEAMLQDERNRELAQRIPGVTISREEIFSVKPNKFDAEISQGTLKAFKKRMKKPRK